MRKQDVLLHTAPAVRGPRWRLPVSRSTHVPRFPAFQVSADGEVNSSRRRAAPRRPTTPTICSQSAVRLTTDLLEYPHVPLPTDFQDQTRFRYLRISIEKLSYSDWLKSNPRPNNRSGSPEHTLSGLKKTVFAAYIFCARGCTL